MENGPEKRGGGNVDQKMGKGGRVKRGKDEDTWANKFFDGRGSNENLKR